MTNYCYMSTRSLSGYTAVTLEYKGETPLGTTFQYETIFVQAYGAEDARNKVQRLLKKSAAECVTPVGETESSKTGHSVVEIGENVYYLPTEVYNKIRQDTMLEQDTNGGQAGDDY